MAQPDRCSAETNGTVCKCRINQAAVQYQLFDEHLLCRAEDCRHSISQHPPPPLQARAQDGTTAQQFEVNHDKAVDLGVTMGCRTLLESLADDFRNWHSRQKCTFVISSTNAALDHFETCQHVDRTEGVFDSWLAELLEKNAPELRPPTQGSFKTAYGILSQYTHCAPLLREIRSNRPIIPANINAVQKRLIYRYLKAQGDDPVVYDNGIIREPREDEKQSPVRPEK